MSAMLDTLAAVVPQNPSFYAGAVLIGTYQASRFSEIGRADVIAGRYITALGGVRLRDFTGASTYALGLLCFIFASLVIYYFLYSFPSVITGLLKVMQVKPPEDTLSDSSTYPLYLAMAFVGIEKLRLPVVSDISDQLRIFFQDQTDVPQGLNREINDWLEAIKRRSGGSKERLIREIDALIDPAWTEFRQHADVTFFDERYRKILGDRDLRQMSRSELLVVLESVLTIVAVTLMRRSGPMFDIVRTRISATTAPVETSPGIGKLFASIFLFVIACLAIWQIVSGLDGVMPYVTGKSAIGDFWPDNPYYSMIAVTSRIPLTLGPLLLALYLWRRTHGTRTEPVDPDRLNVLSPSGLVDNLSAYAGILAACVACGMALNLLDLLNGYGVTGANPNLDASYFPRKAALVFLQALIPLPACYALLVMLENVKAGATRLPLLPAMAFVAAGVALASLLHAKTHLAFDLLRSFPDMQPGTEYVLLSMFVSLAMFLAAFLCMAISVRRRPRRRPEIVPEAALPNVLPLISPAPPPVLDRPRNASLAK